MSDFPVFVSACPDGFFCKPCEGLRRSAKLPAATASLAMLLAVPGVLTLEKMNFKILQGGFQDAVSFSTPQGV